MVSGVRLEDSYIAIRYLHDTQNYPIAKLCAVLNINRSSYYKWLNRKSSTKQLQNEQIIGWIKELYEEQNGILGIASMWLTYDRLDVRLLEHPSTKNLTENSFTVYLLHEPLMHIIFMSTLAYFKSDFVHILLYFVLPEIIILLCAYIGKMLRNRCPRLNSIITGGR